MTTEATIERARKIALTVLEDQPSTTEADIDLAVASALAALGPLGETVDSTGLRRRLEADVSVFVGEGHVLEDHDANHRPWLDARRADTDWPFWEAYRAWSLRRVPADVVRAQDRMTDDILGRLEEPRREGRWDRRGMVVGQVQSGKTSNYTGLICKAADAGYKFIVVLAGLHNSLRSQTRVGSMRASWASTREHHSRSRTRTGRSVSGPAVVSIRPPTRSHRATRRATSPRALPPGLRVGSARTPCCLSLRSTRRFCRTSSSGSRQSTVSRTRRRVA